MIRSVDIDFESGGRLRKNEGTMFGSSSTQETGQLASDNRRLSSSDATSPRHIGNSEEAADDSMVHMIQIIKANYSSPSDRNWVCQVSMMRSIRAATACGGIGITIGMLFRQQHASHRFLHLTFMSTFAAS